LLAASSAASHTHARIRIFGANGIQKKAFKYAAQLARVFQYKSSKY